MSQVLAAIVMSLSVLEGRFPIASVFKCDFWYLWRVARSLCICRASCLLKPVMVVLGVGLALKSLFTLLFRARTLADTDTNTQREKLAVYFKVKLSRGRLT